MEVVFTLNVDFCGIDCAQFQSALSGCLQERQRSIVSSAVLISAFLHLYIPLRAFI